MLVVRNFSHDIYQGFVGVLHSCEEFKEVSYCECRVSCLKTYVFKNTYVVLSKGSRLARTSLWSIVTYGKTRYLKRIVFELLGSGIRYREQCQLIV